MNAYPVFFKANFDAQAVGMAHELGRVYGHIAGDDITALDWYFPQVSAWQKKYENRYAGTIERLKWCSDPFSEYVIVQRQGHDDFTAFAGGGFLDGGWVPK